MMELTHAYCTSIHKSQGSEFPIVIMPIVKQYFRMLQRPILYTGLTRAKTSLVLLGDPEAFDIGLKTNGQARLTQLCTLLKGYFNSDSDDSATTFVENGTSSKQNDSIESDDNQIELLNDNVEVDLPENKSTQKIILF